MSKILFGTVMLVVLSLMTVGVLSAADSPPRIEIEKVKAMLDSGQAVTFIDTRNGSSWSSSGKMIPGAIRVRGGQEFANVMTKLSKDAFIVTYCT